MNLDAIETTLAEQGWLTIELPDPSGIFEMRNFLIEKLRETFPTLERLDDYHCHVTDYDRHVAIMFDLARAYWDSGLSRRIILSNLEFFRLLIGPDLLIQPAPYLRSVLPSPMDDAVPLHRDTYYGASPYEVSVVIPLTDMEESQALRVISGSHLAPDSDYPYIQTLSPDVEVRSAKHQLGYPYAPRLLDPALMARAQPVPMKVGEVLMFPLQLVHGGGINTGTRTRFSTDIRLANALAPVKRSRGVREDYFVPLCTSAVTRAAQEFLARQG